MSPHVLVNLKQSSESLSLVARRRVSLAWLRQAARGFIAASRFSPLAPPLHRRDAGLAQADCADLLEQAAL